MSRVAAFTGHRPNKLNGYNPKDNIKLLWKLADVVEDLIVNQGYTAFITGMALGIDTWAAKIVLKLQEKYPHIQLICAIPCANHSGKWREGDKKIWQEIVDRAEDVVYVSTEEYTPYCMQARNVFMVDHCSLLVGVWDGTAGGTGNCVDYAVKKKTPTLIINPNDFK